MVERFGYIALFLGMSLALTSISPSWAVDGSQKLGGSSADFCKATLHPVGLDQTILSVIGPDITALDHIVPSPNRVLFELTRAHDFTVRALFDLFGHITSNLHQVFSKWKKLFSELTGILSVTEDKLDYDLSILAREVESLLRSARAEELRNQRITEAATQFRIILNGVLGEVKASFFFRERLIQKNAYVGDVVLAHSNKTAESMLQDVRKNRTLTASINGRSLLVDRIDRLIDLYHSHERGGRNAERLFDRVRMKYPALFERAARMNWRRALERLKTLEIDLITVGENKPLSFVEVKSRSHVLDLEDFNPETSIFGAKLDHSIDQLLQLVDLLDLQDLVEVVAYFPNGITTRARTAVANRFKILVYCGTDGQPEPDPVPSSGAPAPSSR